MNRIDSSRSALKTNFRCLIQGMRLSLNILLGDLRRSRSKILDRRAAPHLKYFSLIIAMSVVNNILFIAPYIILFVIWMAYRSFPLTLIGAVLLFFIIASALNRKVSLFSVFPMLFLVLDLILSSSESGKSQKNIRERRCQY